MSLETSLEKLGEARTYDLFELSVVYPAAATWYLAKSDLSLASSPIDLTSLYQGIVVSASGVVIESAVDGQGASSLDLTLMNVPGRFGSGGGRLRKFGDLFAMPAPGYEVPYDFNTATLAVKLVSLRRDNTIEDIKTLATLRADPTATRLAGTEISFHFVEDRDVLPMLPRHTVDRSWAPNAPDSSIGKTVPDVLGRDLTVPGVLIDPAIGQYSISESPNQPRTAIKALKTVQKDPVTDEDKIYDVYWDSGQAAGPVVIDSFSDVSATDWQALASRGQVQRIKYSGFLSSYSVTMRKATATAPAGEITLRVEYLASGLPSGEMVAREATAKIDASLVTAAAGGAGQTITFTFDPAPFVIIGDVAFTLRYAQTGGAGDIELRGNPNGGYANGYAIEKLTSDNDWISAIRNVDLLVGGGLANEGLVFDHVPIVGFGGIQVLAWVDHYGMKGQYVGELPDRSSGLHVNARSFYRVSIAGYAATGLDTAYLRLFITNTSATSGSSIGPPGDLVVEEIADFGTLDAADYNAPLLAGTQFGTTTTPGALTITAVAAPPGQFYDVDIKAAVLDAIADGRTVLAFRLRNPPEAGTGSIHFWHIAAAEAGKEFAPRVALIYGGSRDIHFSLSMLNPLVEQSVVINSNLRIGRVTFAQPLGEQTIIAAFMNGNRDNNAADYSGVTGNPVLENGADLIQFIARDVRAGLGLADAQMDLTAFAAARDALNNAGWPKLAGVIWEQLPAEQWIARIARCCRAIVFYSGGKLTIRVDLQGQDSTRRRVRPWEHANCQISPSGGASEKLPWTKVEVFYARDLLNLPSAALPSRNTEWKGYAIVSKEFTFPPDADRQAQASALVDRYKGERTNGTGGPGDDNSYYFIPRDTPGIDFGRMQRDYEWDNYASKTPGLELLEVDLPKWAADWNLMDEFDLEDYNFPSVISSARFGEVTFPSSAGPMVFNNGAMQFYSARRGRFTVRTLTVNMAAKQGWPVHVVGKLVGWQS